MSKTIDTTTTVVQDNGDIISINVPPNAKLGGYGPSISYTAVLQNTIPEQKSSGVKHDQEKPDMSLLSSIAMFEVAKVMTFGKKKYNANNWRGGITYSRLLAAALRHIFSYLGGEAKDPESGISHAAHAICCLMMLLEFETTKPELDDRYKNESN